MLRFSTVYRIVLFKELRELLRDRRSLLWLFAPPIILPGIAICAGVFIGTQAIRIAEDGFPIVIENPEAGPELVERLEEADAVNVLDPPPPDSDDRFGDAIMVVVIPPDFQAQLETSEGANIELLTGNSAFASILGREAVRGVINQYNNDLLDERLAEIGQDRRWLRPITIGERRVAQRDSATAVVSGDEEDEGGSNILATIFLPLAVTSWLLGGGMGLILDTTVGEKERQTIENLLVTPANRMGIVMGKMTVVFLASMAVMGLWLLEGVLLNALSISGAELAAADDLTLTSAISTVLANTGGILPLLTALILIIVPFTVMLNGVMMSWASYAANYREANLFMALLQLGLPATVLLTIFSFPSDLPEIIYALPFLGTIVAIRDLFSDSLSFGGLMVSIVSGALYSVIAVYVAAWVFGREWSLTRGLQ